MSTFDPTKPVRWKNGRPFGRLLYADGGDSFFYEATDGVRSILSREFFERNAENIPEPPPKPGPTDLECSVLAQNVWASRWSAGRDATKKQGCFDPPANCVAQRSESASEHE